MVLKCKSFCFNLRLLHADRFNFKNHDFLTDSFVGAYAYVHGKGCYYFGSLVLFSQQRATGLTSSTSPHQLAQGLPGMPGPVCTVAIYGRHMTIYGHLMAIYGHLVSVYGYNFIISHTHSQGGTQTWLSQFSTLSNFHSFKFDCFHFHWFQFSLFKFSLRISSKFPSRDL